MFCFTKMCFSLSELVLNVINISKTVSFDEKNRTHYVTAVLIGLIHET